MSEQFRKFWADRNWSLVVVSLIVAVMALWLIVEALLSFARGRGGLDFDRDGTVDTP